MRGRHNVHDKIDKHIVDNMQYTITPCIWGSHPRATLRLCEQDRALCTNFGVKAPEISDFFFSRSSTWLSHDTVSCLALSTAVTGTILIPERKTKSNATTVRYSMDVYKISITSVILG